MALVKITLYVESKDTNDAPDWRNHTRLMDRARKDMPGATVKFYGIEEWDGLEPGGHETGWVS